MILRNSTHNKKSLQHLDKQLESPQSPDAIYHLPPLTPYPSVDPSYIPHKAARMIKYVSMTEKEEDVSVENNGMRKMSRNDHLNSLLISQYQQELPENPKRNLSIDSQGKGQRGFLTGLAAVRSRQTEFLEDGTFGDKMTKNEQNLVRNKNRANEEPFDVEETRELGMRWQEKANKLGGFYRSSKRGNQAKESESNSEGSEEMQIETRKENKKERGVRPRRSYSKYDEIEEEEEDIEEVKSKNTFRRKNVDRYEEEEDKDDYGYEHSDNPSGDDLDLGYGNQRREKNRSLLESRINEVKTSDTEQEKVLFSGRIAKRVKRPSKENQDESLKNEESVLSTPMERFRAILEKNMQPSVNKIEGKCLSMTPLSKTRSHDLFEKERGTGIPKPEWFVKKYDRNAVNQDDPNQLRPLSALRETMDYLVNNILDVEKKKSTKYALPRGIGRYCFDDIHNFLSSTLSSIRQDISLQGVSTERQAIELYEEIVRYHLIAINEGRDSENKNFDANSNMEQVTEALASLKYAYNVARNMANKAYSLLKDQSGFEIKMLKQFEDKFYLSPNEPEFIAYDAVLQLDRELNPADILKNVNKYPEELLESKEVKFAIKVVTAVKENNYTQYFKLLGEADYLTSCAMSASIKSIREKAVKSMVDSQTSTSTKKMSVNEFYELLAFEDYDEAMEFLRAYGLEEVSQGISIDDIQGSEDVVFKLKKVDIKDEKEKLEAKKRFLELKPAMNVRIIEIKRNIENFKGTYQREKDIHFDNTQVSRRFIVRGTWKKEDTEYIGKLLKSVETGKCKEILSDKEIVSNKMRSSKESPMRVTEVSKKRDGKGLSPKEFKKLEEELEKARKKEMQEEEEQKELKKVQNSAINKMFKLLNTVLAWNKKELLMTLEADLEYEREFKTFRDKILEKNKNVLRGIANQKLKPTTTLKKSGFTVGDWDEYSFFGFLADALSEQEPGLERYCYKAVVFHPLYRDIHFELFKYLVDFLTDSRENLEQLEFDQLPVLYESQNIHFESEGMEKKLWVSFKVFDENYRAEGYIDEDRMSEESGSGASEERHHVVPAVDISTSNLVIFVLTGNKKLDKKRFEPIYNAVNEKKHLDNTNILFLQMYELSEHKPAEKIRKHEIIEMFNLDKIETKGIQLHFIKIPYVHSTDIENNRFFFKDIEYVLKDKVTAVVKTGIDERVYTKLPSFYTLKDLTEKLRNSLEDLRALSIDYESTGIEVKAQILHEIMSSNSIEAYYYVKNFINHAVNSIKVNFDYWHENIDRIVPEFLENYNEQALDKIKTGKAEFDAILEKMLKINDFDERYWKFLKAGNKLILNTDTVYGLIERKVDRVFTSRKRQIKLDEVVEILENDFKFSAIGIKGAWKQLFRIVYKYYIQFLADLQPICILLDEDFRLNVNIDDLYKDVEEDIKKYNSWIEKLEFHNYEPPVNVVKKTEKMHSSLLRKRPYDAFYASESSIFPKDETMMDNISDLESSIMVREGLLHNMGVDWDFDKQYQTLKRTHVDDGNFLYKITEDHTE